MLITKIYFIDLDGTLIDEGKKVSQKNYDAISHVMQKNKIVSLATGRNMTKSTMEIFNNAKLSNSIFLNGAVIIANNKVIQKEFFPPKANEELLKFFDKTRHFIFANHEIFNNKKDNGRDYLTLFKILKKVGLYSKEKYLAKFSKIFKYSIYVPSQKTARKLMKKIADLNLGVEVSTTANGKLIEITPRGCSKGQAINTMLRHLEIQKERAMHIGDSMNDASALFRVDKLVAVKNASGEFKRYATHLGPESKNGGVGRILTRNNIIRNPMFSFK